MLIAGILLTICMLIAGISIMLTSMKTGVSPSPSSGKTSRAILAATENTGMGPVADLGSGWGSLVIALARKYPQRQIVGYELSFVPWLFSLIRKSLLGLDNLIIYRHDFLNADLSAASVLTCYLLPRGMASLKDKLERDSIDEVLLVSSTFDLPASRPAKVIRVADTYRTPVYLYCR